MSESVLPVVLRMKEGANHHLADVLRQLSSWRQRATPFQWIGIFLLFCFFVLWRAARKASSPRRRRPPHIRLKGKPLNGEPDDELQKHIRWYGVVACMFLAAFIALIAHGTASGVRRCRTPVAPLADDIIAGIGIGGGDGGGGGLEAKQLHAADAKPITAAQDAALAEVKEEAEAAAAAEAARERAAQQDAKREATELETAAAALQEGAKQEAAAAEEKWGPAAAKERRASAAAKEAAATEWHRAAGEAETERVHWEMEAEAAERERKKRKVEEAEHAQQMEVAERRRWEAEEAERARQKEAERAQQKEAKAAELQRRKTEAEEAEWVRQQEAAGRQRREREAAETARQKAAATERRRQEETMEQQRREREAAEVAERQRRDCEAAEKAERQRREREAAEEAERQRREEEDARLRQLQAACVRPDSPLRHGQMLRLVGTTLAITDRGGLELRGGNGHKLLWATKGSATCGRGKVLGSFAAVRRAFGNSARAAVNLPARIRGRGGSAWQPRARQDAVAPEAEAEEEGKGAAPASGKAPPLAISAVPYPPCQFCRLEVAPTGEAILWDKQCKRWSVDRRGLSFDDGGSGEAIASDGGETAASDGGEAAASDGDKPATAAGDAKPDLCVTEDNLVLRHGGAIIWQAIPTADSGHES